MSMSKSYRTKKITEEYLPKEDQAVYKARANDSLSTPRARFKRIDEMVYAPYSLTPEESAIVEGKK